MLLRKLVCPFLLGFKRQGGEFGCSRHGSILLERECIAHHPQWRQAHHENLLKWINPLDKTHHIIIACVPNVYLTGLSS